MNLKGKTGIPKDVFDGNPAISNDKLILVNGIFKRGNYSYVTKRWIFIEEFRRKLKGLPNDNKIVWFDIEK